MQREEKIKEIQNATYKKCLQVLNKKNKCLLVRPTGIGKTYISACIASNKYKNVIYVYPTDIIRSETERKYYQMFEEFGTGILMLSYAKLSRWVKIKDFSKISEFKNMNTSDSLFIFDEAHMMYGENVSQVIKNIMNQFTKAHFLGLTATPYRTDNRDIIYYFFEGNVVADYSLRDAINDGIFKKPIYMYSTINVVQTIDKKIKAIQNEKNINPHTKSEILKTLDARRIELAKIMVNPEVIKESVRKAEIDDDYMKFIIFMPNIYSLSSKKEEVIGWFKEAYPDKKINVYTVTSIERHDLKKISHLKKTTNTIDLIFNINILTMGYHVPDITGVVLFRHTDSDIMASQMIGRVFSVEMSNIPIILDLVGNDKNGKFFASILDKKPKKSYGKRLGDCMDFGKEQVVITNNVKDIEEIDRFIAQMKASERREHWAKMIGKLFEKGVYPPIEYIAKNLFFNDKLVAITYMEKLGYNMNYYKDK